MTAQQGTEAALRADLMAKRQNASDAAELDAAIRLESIRFQIDRETAPKLSLLRRLVRVIRDPVWGAE